MFYPHWSWCSFDLSPKPQWYFHRSVNIKESISVHTTFPLCQSQPPLLRVNNEPIPNPDTAKYLGLIFEKYLIWALRPFFVKFSKSKLISIIFFSYSSGCMVYLQLWGTAKKYKCSNQTLSFAYKPNNQCMN